MDVVPTLYYAAICASLAFAAGGVRRARSRVALGAVVGLAAAAALPLLRGVLGV